MTRVDLTYNPYTRERKLVIDSKEIARERLSSYCGAEGTELSQWCGSLWGKLSSDCNDDIELRFTGILRDFEFLEDAKKKAEEKISTYDFVLEKGKISVVENSLEKLSGLFNEMQRESPFGQLKEPGLKKLFEKAVSSDFEIAVVATMSSGKSTLINAMLGRELLPACNKASTARLARIHDDDAAKNFSACCYDSEGKEIERCDSLDLDVMEQLNKNEKISRIDINGNIPGIQSRSIRLVLTDTPGPNNSQNKDHEKHTLSLLDEDYKPMFLYVLNSTNLGVNDDSLLLDKIVERTKQGGRQSLDRFIFVLNKADEFDPGKGERILDQIDDVKEYLSKKGIKAPRIFPCSSSLAKLIRMSQNGLLLSGDEEDFLSTKPKRFIEDSTRHFSDHAPFLSPATKERQDMEIRRARESGDKHQEALYYSGVPSVELAITEYLEKYALPAKVSQGVQTFQEKIRALGLEADMIEKLKEDREKVVSLKGELEEIASKLSKGDGARKFRDKIKDLSAAKQVEVKLEGASGSFLVEVGKTLEKMRKSDVSPEQAAVFVASLNDKILSLCNSFEVDVQQILKSVVVGQARQYVREYQDYVRGLVDHEEYKDSDPASILGTSASLSFEETMHQYEEQRTESVKVGEHREKNSDYKWYDGIANIFRRKSNKKAKYVWFEDFEDRDYTVVNFERYIEDKVMPGIDRFCDVTKEIAHDYSKEEEQKLKEFFTRQLDKLDAEMRRTVEDKLRKLSSKEELERMIQENEKNKEWLDRFNRQLNDILAI